MKYEYKFIYVGNGSPVQILLDLGWEPVPHVEPVIFKGSMATASTYVFLRKEKP